MKTETQIEIKPSQKICDVVMADCGTEYFTFFRYRVEGDAEIYGDDAWRTGKIVWLTTDEWKTEAERVKRDLAEDPNARVDYGILDDESLACDWDEYEIKDENGDIMPEAVAKKVAALLP